MPAPPSPPDRRKHAEGLKAALVQAERRVEERRNSVGFSIAQAEPGLYIQFDGRPGEELALDSLESRSKGIELVAVTQAEEIQRATVFVPRGQVKHFISRVEQYAEEETAKGEPRNKKLVESITAIRLATLQALWTDEPSTYPAGNEALWFEVWLRKHDGLELERLREFAAKVGASGAGGGGRVIVGRRHLEFEERIVTLVHATPNQLASSLDVMNDIAEIRRATESTATFTRMDVVEQAEWATELKARTRPPGADAPVVCVLDTGVNRAHPMLEDALSPDDMHAVDPDWGRTDHEGHGTEMAGLALYGDLKPVLETSSPIQLHHRLESVTVLPPSHLPATEPELYGNVMAQATSLVEATAVRRRCFSMAVSAQASCKEGEPTSWSAAIDALAAGRSFDKTTQGLLYLDDLEGDSGPPRRLFILCAGNVEPEDFHAAHLDKSDLTNVFDPAQAWNALTVGACTHMRGLEERAVRRGWGALADAGELSPFSSTSVGFQSSWPIKPDVVLEGGNLATDAVQSQLWTEDALSLLTTNRELPKKLFVSSCGTSAATSQAGRMAAELAAAYPSFWPETIRGLIVHSAEWTPAMRAWFKNGLKARPKENLRRRYGHGLPNLERALRSARNAVTLIVQERISPFRGDTFGDIHVHELPWPQDLLSSLGDARVRLRVTLSYFVEPNPSRLGWRRRHSYASHGLRFKLMPSSLSVPEFEKRLNKRALEEGEKRPEAEGDKGWVFPVSTDDKGSLHSNIWSGTAAELALRGAIGVVPISGWWKGHGKDRSGMGAPYSLIVSIETEEETADLWTPIAIKAGVPIAIET